jgi:hypothetical protein
MKLEGSHKKAFGYGMGLTLFCKSYIGPWFLLIEKQETGPYFTSVEPVNGAPFYRKSSFEIDDKKVHFGGIEPGPLDQILRHYTTTHSKALKQC